LTKGSSTRNIVVRAGDLELSGILSGPAEGPVRGLILALHGGGYSSGYWNNTADEGRLSLLELGAVLGFHVLALDRPGYGHSKNGDRSLVALETQATVLFDAIDAWSREFKFNGPAFVIGHSIGAMITLLMAAHPRSARLSGVDVLGFPLRLVSGAETQEIISWPTTQTHVPALSAEMHRKCVLGPAGTYSTEAVEYDLKLTCPMSVVEFRDAITLPGTWPHILPTIHIPVQLTMAEHEVMQVTGAEALREAQGLLGNSAHARFHLQPASGHNASMHYIARAYHLRAIAFFEECLALKGI
jgi:pimeloyl-ACP methyl ester carboxylesterase